MAILGVGALAALRGYFWIQDGETWKAILLGAGFLFGAAVAGWGWWRWKRARSRVYDPILIKEKVSRIAFDGQLQVTAFLRQGDTRKRSRELLGSVAAAYRHYDHPAGARFKVSKVRPAVPSASLQPPGPGLFGKRSVLGVREVAALWHPPGARDETPLVERSGARVLLPSARGVRGGAPVGHTTAGTPRDIHFPEDLLRRHHLYVARTRMGKSTLMHHVVAHKMREKAEGRDNDAIVVVDPHTDLVSGLLRHVPESLADQVRLIDLADERGAPGINLLDTRIFADRDRTADSVVRVARGLWDQWGPRMQSILEQTVKTLHEANERMEAEQQYTILDGLRLLSDAKFKGRVLAKVSDPYLLEWWSRDFGQWHRQYKAEALAPVQTRLSYYASSKRARAILGQSRSTIDMRQVILEGGVLLVSTSQGTAGRDVAALVGASILNLVDAVIREQGGTSLEKRRGVLVVVDEMQSMPGVDYESMLSELGKFGASFILATQSLAKLSDLSRTMQDTLLANIGCLCVFQVAGADARTLVWELGKDRVSEDDITSLPVHQCYVRATVGTERMPAFSMMVRKPEPGDSETAARIRAATTGYTTSAQHIADKDAGPQKLVDDYHAGLQALKNGHAPTPRTATLPHQERPRSHTKNGHAPTPRTATLPHQERPRSHTKNGHAPTPRTATLPHQERPRSHTKNGHAPTPRTATLPHQERPRSHTKNGHAPTPRTATLPHQERPRSHTKNGHAPTPRTATLPHQERPRSHTKNGHAPTPRTATLPHQERPRSHTKNGHAPTPRTATLPHQERPRSHTKNGHAPTPRTATLPHQERPRSHTKNGHAPTPRTATLPHQERPRSHTRREDRL